MWYAWFTGADGITEWHTLQEQKTVESPIHSFRLGPFVLTVPGESYIIFEYFSGSMVEHNAPASLFFLFVLVASVLVLLTVITTLKRFWYTVGMGIFIVFVVSLRFEVLLLFGTNSMIVPVGVLILFVGTSYYFKSFRPDISFNKRLLCFSLLALIVAILIYFFAEAQFPGLHLTVTAYTAALVLSVIFIIMVAHEIPAAFVYLTQSTSKTLQHFLLISVIYLLNLLITCFHEMGVIDWNFLYINLYLLLTLSALVGIWGFRQQEPQYEHIIFFMPFGAFFYLAMAAICFAFTGQLLANANDVALKIIRDIIIFSHTGFGIIFLTYIFSNFMVMMADNLPIHKVLYKPNRMPYFTFRLAGIITMLAFVFYSNWREYVYHGLAGFYNYIADLYRLQDNNEYAQAFYERSRDYAFQNNRANYALGVMKSARLNFEQAHYNYQLANSKRPTEFSLINDGNLYFRTGDWSEAIRNLRKAEKVKPHSGFILNNLGFAYSKIHALDSSIHYLNLAREEKQTQTTAETNFFAVATSEYLPVKADSVLRLFNSQSPATIGNALALATFFKQPFSNEPPPLTEKPLDLHTATWLNNYIMYNARDLDTDFINRAIRIASDSVNFDFSEALKASLAYAYYYSGNVTKALEILAGLTYTTLEYKGKYNYIMGLWALDQGQPDIASSYFSHAETAHYKNAPFYNAISLTEARRIDEAIVAWEALKQQGGEDEKAMADRILRILTLTPAQAMIADDADKYYFSRYHIGIRDTTFFKRLTLTFSNSNYKAQALLDMSRKLLRSGHTRAAVSFFQQINGLELTDKKLYDDVHQFELLLLASLGDGETLAQRIGKVREFEQARTPEAKLYTAMIFLSKGKTELAQKNFEEVGTQNPYFEEGVLAASSFFREHAPESMKAYNILVEAIQVNPTSLRLLKAYADEAARMGFDEYAQSARQRVAALEMTPLYR